MLKYRKDELDPTKKMFLKKSNVLKNKRQIFLKCLVRSIQLEYIK